MGERGRVVALSLGLVVLVWIVFAQVLRYDFVNYDDDAYVYLEPRVVSGLTWDGIQWAFSHFHSGNWHPLTSISHMLDAQLWGLAPRGHHLSSVLLHAANAVLLFLVFRVYTGQLWRSAFVSALFAIHPLRVESVAWIAERKDVLSGLFFLLTLLAYARYTRRPSWLGYVAVALLFACGLMSKPMLVTLPCLLLLLDVWPLRREASWSRLLREKIPLFALSAASCVVTVIAQASTIESLEMLPIPARIGHALVALLAYMRDMIWPARLAVLYPLRETVPIALALFAGLVVTALTVLAVLRRREFPYLALGWFWFVGMLIPVIGIMQVGRQSHADRYTYLPQIGLYLALTWWIADRTAQWKHRSQILTASALLVLAALATTASMQASHWRDSGTLWRRALAVTERNYVAHTNLGNFLPAREALPHYEMALAIQPDSPLPASNVAWILATAPDPNLRDGARAVRWAEQANRAAGNPDPLILRTLAASYAEAGRFADAIRTAEAALPLAEAAGQPALAFDLRNNIAGYKVGEPVRDLSLEE